MGAGGVGLDIGDDGQVDGRARAAFEQSLDHARPRRDSQNIGDFGQFRDVQCYIQTSMVTESRDVVTG